MCAQAKCSVLVVEDEAALRRMICAALEMKGFDVYQARNGVEALERLAMNQVDLLVTDWNMPEMSGGELLAHVRGEQTGPRLPVLVVSGAVSPNSPGVVPGSFDKWLKKPFRISDIQAVVLDLFENG